MTLDYALTFLQSNLLEIPFYFVTHVLVLGEEKSWKGLERSIGRTTFANLITHPIVFFGFLSRGSGLTWLSGILAAEAFAVIGETLLHRYSLGSHAARYSLTRPWIGSFVGALFANLVSWELGPLLTYLWT